MRNTSKKPTQKQTASSKPEKSNVQRNTFVALGFTFLLLLVWFGFWLWDFIKDNFPNSAIFGAVNASTAEEVTKPAVVNNYVTHENVTHEYNNTNIGGGRYVHKELSPKLTWIIDHQLGVEPSIDVYGTDNEILAFATREDVKEERFTTDNPPVAYDFYYRTILNFSSPQTGYVFLTN